MHNLRPLAALALLGAGVAASAQPVPPDGDCDLLAQAVRRHVWLAATEARLDVPERRKRSASLYGAERRVCRRTAEVTTRAFGEALATFGLSVGWEPPHPGDYCLSGDLSQCYPDIAPGDPRLPAARTAFVYEAWRGVRDAVESLMPAGSAGGAAVFSADTLDEALAARLRESVEAPLHARPAMR